MKVLIYVEPHPIRDSLVHFGDVAARLSTFLVSPGDYDVRMFANNPTFKKIKDRLKPYSNRLVPTTEIEDADLQSYLEVPWVPEGLAVWHDLMRGKGEAAELQLNMLRRIWNEFPFQIIVHWGENGAVNRFLDEHPVTRVALELGCTRPPFFDSLVMDPFGTNGSSVVSKLGLQDLRGIVNGRSLSKHESLGCFSSDTQSTGYSLQFDPLPGELGSRLVNQKIAFLPLQLFDDANLVRFSPYATLKDVVLDVVPKLSEAGYLTIIKPHPASKHRKGAKLENTLARTALQPWIKDVIWLQLYEGHQIPAARLLALADLVITVNSSVGFEALYYDKPVVVMGDAIYKASGVFPSLEDVLLGRFDLESYLDAAGILRRFMLGGYLQPGKILDYASLSCDRLGIVHHAWQYGAADPVSYANEFWRSLYPSQLAEARSRMFWGISEAAGSRLNSAHAKGTSLVTNNRSTVLASIAQGYQLRLPSISQLRAKWLALKTEQWLTDQWMSSSGRFEVVSIGSIVDQDYYLKRYPELENAGVDPVLHYALEGIEEGRSPQAQLSRTSAESMLSHLCVCAKYLEYDLQGISSALQISSEELSAYGAISRRIRKYILDVYGDSFADWISGAWNNQQARKDIIRLCQLVDPEYYLGKYQDVRKASIDPIEHYAMYGITEGRCPRRGCENLDSETIERMITSMADKGQQALPAPVYLLPKDLELKRKKDLRRLRESVLSSKCRIAVIAHLYYTDLVPDILIRLAAIKEPFDLIVTMPDWGARRITELVQEAYPSSLFYASVNRGRDIGPFMDLLPTLIDKDYDVILKLQTKRGYFRSNHMIPEYGEIWRKDTFDALLGSESRVSAILHKFSAEPQLNMVGPEPFLLPLYSYPYHDGGILADALIGELRPDNGQFFAGTMFWVRPSCLQPLAQLNTSHFGSETGANDGGLEHLIERMFADAAAADSGMLASAPVDPEICIDMSPRPNNTTIDAYMNARHRESIASRRAMHSESLMW
ncbi:rhamnan synthesis F family protein [Aphanothece microscopica]|uniref:rhamnan synthesis F family protein n=1 Tax=Aphanothece microscopica TaxID=1049561 RepID=UPI003984B146